MPHSTVSTAFTQDIVEMISVGIGYKYLAELIAFYNLHDPLHTCRIQFVKNIVK